MDGISTLSSMASKRGRSAGPGKKGKGSQEKIEDIIAPAEPESFSEDTADETFEVQPEDVPKLKEQKGKQAVPKEAAVKAKEPQAKKDTKPKVSQKAAKSRAKKGKDPILAICTAILLLSSAIVIVATIDDKFFSESDTSAVTAWDNVKVDYVGSFYGYYDEGGMIFDTSIESIGKNDDYLKSYGFSKTSYSSLTFIVGKGTMLTMFEDALLGMRPGETVRIEIPAGEGYGNGTSLSPYTDLEMDRILTMTKEQCTAYIGSVPAAGVILTAKTPFGWDAQAILDPVSGAYIVIQNPSEGDTYTQKGDESETPDVRYEVTGMTSDKIIFDYAFSEDVAERMSTTGWHVKALDKDAREIYLYGQESEGVMEYQYKYPTTVKDANNKVSSTETNDVVLYFEIRFIGYA